MDHDRLTAGAVVAFFVVSAGLVASQRYTVSDPWQPYTSAVQQFMAAGVRGDSSWLTRQSASEEPIQWVLDAARRQPTMLKGWTTDLEAGAGERHGDTVVVLLWANNVEGCSRLSSVSASLLNHSASPRLLTLSSPCIDRRPLPALPW
jgi:hypothetical protein